MLDQLINYTTLESELNTVQRAREKESHLYSQEKTKKHQLIPSISAQMTCSLRTTESHNKVY